MRSRPLRRSGPVLMWAGQRWPSHRRWPVLASPGQVMPWLTLVVLGLNIPSLARQLISFDIFLRYYQLFFTLTLVSATHCQCSSSTQSSQTLVRSFLCCTSALCSATVLVRA
jgi:hypothetical protein